MPHRSILFLAAASIVLLGAGSAPAGPYYLTDLGALAGSTNPTSYALAVNDYGVVVGTSSTSKSSTKFTTATIYTPGSGGWTDIGSSFKGLLGITSAGTFANAINDAGQVAGYLYEATPVNNTDSFIYNTATQAYTDMAAQPGVCNGAQVQCGENMWNATVVEYEYPGSINSSGQIGGEYTNTAGVSGAFVWNGNSTAQVSTPATPAGTTLVSGINNNGVVVGDYAIGMDPVPVGFYSVNGTEHDISSMAYPQAIAGNEVVGADWPNTNGPTYAAIYTIGAASATYIGTAGQDSFAYGASSNGTVVGYNGNDAFLYTGGTMTDLNTLTIGPNPFSDLNVAYGISPNGQYIVGDGTVASTGYTYGFLLTAAIPGDANGDGKVDINDLTIVLAHYNQTGQTWANGEFTGDGTVDINDLTIVLAHYGDTVASSAAGNPSAVPEPAGAVLLVCGGLAALAAGLRRRK